MRCWWAIEKGGSGREVVVAKNEGTAGGLENPVTILNFIKSNNQPIG
jgi:hypothetical protein